MKKLFLFIGTFAMSFLNAQDITDAVRYSQQNIIGSARFMGMSGAFGALGGDISALQVNPAGSGVFLNSYGSITLSSNTINNQTSYNGDLFANGVLESNRNNLNFNQLGFVSIYNLDEQTKGINKFALGFTYHQTADNVDQFRTQGQSRNSIDSYFLSAAQGIQTNTISRRAGESVSDLYAFLGENEGFDAQQAFLGNEAFIFNPVDADDPNNTVYVSNIAPGSFNQEYFYESTGLNGKFSFNLGTQIDQKFYVGINLNSHFINFDRVTEFFEANNNTGSTTNEVIFTNRLSANGAGFSAQIGGIAKVSNMLRLGASYESPTYYFIEEETTQRLESISDTDGRALANPEVVNIFPEYQIRTPESYTGSVAILFGQQGLISLDYTYKDYTSTEFRSDFGNSFASLNSVIDNTLGNASTIRIGGEWRDGNFSYTAGYRFEESPYSNTNILGDKNGFSAGFGYNFGKYRFDIAYDYEQQDRIETFFPDSGFNNFSYINTYRDNLIFTLGINF